MDYLEARERLLGPWTSRLLRLGAKPFLASQRGVGLLPADAFAVGRETLAHAVRINLGAAPSLNDLRHALSIIAALLNAGHLEISCSV
jgi:hypothetical protein